MVEKTVTKKQKVIELDLPFWQNPQCYVFTEHQRDDVNVYCQIWDKSGDALQSKLGKIRFFHVLACMIERKIIYDLPKKPKSKSCIMEVLHSNYLANYCHQRWLCDITPQELICYRHFLVHSHDHQVSILAKNYHAKVVKVGKKTKRIAKILA